MENYLYKNYKDINDDNLSEKYLYKKIEKKKKIKACQIQVKEFFSDNEEDNIKNNKYEIIDKYIKQRKVKINCTPKKSKNSILLYKEQLQKKSTMDHTPNKKSERLNIFKEDICSKNTGRNKKAKKVNFPENNFVIYINIESFKKYNCENSYINPYRENKADSKCCMTF